MSVLLAIYNPETGDILRRVTCSENVAEIQTRKYRALVIERGTIFTDATHRVDLNTLQLVVKE